jgi:hypothetical protein
MLRRLITAVVALAVFTGVMLADEIRAVITKVDGDKVTFTEVKGKGERGEEKTLPVSADAKIVKGTFNRETKKVEPGDKLEGGLKNKMFTDIGEKGVGARIITDDSNKTIKEIIVFERKGKGKQ